MKNSFNNKRFFRDPTNAKVAGVCSGLAKYLDINPWVVRGVAVVAFLFSPSALGLAYVLAILLVKYKYSY